jgi:hypothetical protein
MVVQGKGLRGRNLLMPAAPEHTMNPPTTLEDVMAWPGWLLRDLDRLDVDMVGRLREKLQGGVELKSAFTGIDCFRMGSEMVARQLGFEVGQAVCCTETCDSDLTCESVLRRWQRPAGHRMDTDILNRLNPWAEAAIEVISDEVHKAFTTRLCAGETKQTLRDELGQEAYDRMTVVLMAPDAYRFRFRCKAASRCKTTMFVGGTPCINWSSQGERSGMAGRTNMCFMVWLIDRVRCQEDLIVHECTPLFELKWLRQALGRTHDIMAMDLSPIDLGIPTQRRRKWTIMAKKGRFEWADRLDDDDGTRNNFIILLLLLLLLRPVLLLILPLLRSVDLCVLNTIDIWF